MGSKTGEAAEILGKIETNAKKAGIFREGFSKAGLNQSRIDEILSMERGTRPDPSSYLSRDYVANHLAEFDEGVTKITSNTPSGVDGPPGGTFVMPKSVADALIKQSAGDI